MQKLSLFFLFFWCTGVLFGQGDQVLHVSSSDEIHPAALYFGFVKDDQDTLSKEELIQADFLTFLNQKAPNLGITDDTYWGRLKLQNDSPDSTFTLELDYPLLDEVTLYQYNENGEWKDQTLGDFQSYSNRQYDHQNYFFDLVIPPGSRMTYVFKLRSKKGILLPMYVGKSQQLLEKKIKREYFQGIYFGIVLVIIFYNLFIFVGTGDRSQLYYVIYTFVIGSLQACLFGYTYRYVWPESPWLADQALFILAGFTGLTAILYVREFLQTKVRAPKLDRGFLVICGFYAIAFALDIAGSYALSLSLLNICTLILAVYIFFPASYIHRQGFRPAKFFLIAWSVFLLSSIAFVLRNFGIIPYNDYTHFILPVGSGLEITLLSLAVADRLNSLRKEKEHIVQNQNKMLEIKVQERTQLLEEAYGELKATNSELQIAQNEIVLLHEKESAALHQKNLQLQLNPHFIFNSLNSIYSIVLKKDSKFAGVYLSRYSRLMRLILENSREEFIPLEQEVESLKLYLSLEQLRFKDLIEYSFEIDEQIFPEEHYVPPMLLQPFIENAILHGIAPKGSLGNIHVSFHFLNDQQIRCRIEDDGIGRKRSQELKTQVKQHNSIGMEVISKRLDSLETQVGVNETIKITDKETNGIASGTLVEVILPVKLGKVVF